MLLYAFIENFTHYCCLNEIVSTSVHICVEKLSTKIDIDVDVKHSFGTISHYDYFEYCNS